MAVKLIQSMNLSNHVILITGNTGIAAATARLAALAGARVFIAGLDAEQGAALAKEIGGASPSGIWSGDLTVPENADVCVAQCIETLGQIDGLFNVAGASGRRHGDGPLHEASDEGWNWTVDVNLNSMFYMTRAVLRHMLERDHSGQRRGAIVNMATVTAYSPEPENFATHGYAAAKGGVIAMTKAAAAYYAPHGIRINAVAPGLVRTPMSQRAQTNAEIIEQMRHKQPLAQGLLEPEDVAHAALFLLSDEARFITGQILAVDGGWSVSA